VNTFATRVSDTVLLLLLTMSTPFAIRCWARPWPSSSDSHSKYCGHFL